MKIMNFVTSKILDMSKHTEREHVLGSNHNITLKPFVYFYKKCYLRYKIQINDCMITSEQCEKYLLSSDVPYRSEKVSFTIVICESPKVESTAGRTWFALHLVSQPSVYY